MEVKHCTLRMRTFNTIWRSNIVHWGWGKIELDFNFVFKICFCLVYCLSPMAQFCQFSNFSRTKRFSSVFGTIQRNNRNVFMLNLFLYLILYSFFYNSHCSRLWHTGCCWRCNIVKTWKYRVYSWFMTTSLNGLCINLKFRCENLE